MSGEREVSAKLWRENVEQIAVLSFKCPSCKQTIGIEVVRITVV